MVRCDSENKECPERCPHRGEHEPIKDIYDWNGFEPIVGLCTDGKSECGYRGGIMTVCREE